MNPLFHQTQARFLQASRKRFADWGEANNHRQVGGAIAEFRELFVVHSSSYERLRWVRAEKPIYYRQAQLVADMCDRMLGHTLYGKMFSKLTCEPPEGNYSGRARHSVRAVSGRQRPHRGIQGWAAARTE